MTHRANIDLFKVKNKITRKRCEICSKLAINTRTTSKTSRDSLVHIGRNVASRNLQVLKIYTQQKKQ